MSSPPSASFLPLSWVERRRDVPRTLRDEEALLDVTLVAKSDGRQFRAHK